MNIDNFTKSELRQVWLTVYSAAFANEFAGELCSYPTVDEYYCDQAKRQARYIADLAVKSLKEEE